MKVGRIKPHEYDLPDMAKYWIPKLCKICGHQMYDWWDDQGSCGVQCSNEDCQGLRGQM
jgi:hypothetical protein